MKVIRKIILCGGAPCKWYNDSILTYDYIMEFMNLIICFLKGKDCSFSPDKISAVRQNYKIL